MKAYAKLTLFIIAIIVMLELALFISGRYLLWQRRAKKNTLEAIRIACVGDSHSFGVGTSMLYSYPAQLERLLTLNNYGQRFFVINLGIPGASTKRQAQELNSFFSCNEAKIVILLTGRNNDIEIKQWGNASPYNKIANHLGSFRSFKFLKVISDRILGINKERDSNEMPACDQRYADYLNFYLAKIRKLCRDKGSKLVLLSYYNSSDSVIKAFAYKYSIPYLDFTSDFESLFRAGEKLRYISPDMSHLNHLGYKFFTEQLYGCLFLQQAYLGIKINPLLQSLGEKNFYSNNNETARMIKLQEERIAQSKDSGGYPFELIHLGHIYIEIGNNEAAKECYLKALLSSNYSDNNTIVSPIINWYLRKGQKDDAMKICDEILCHNPKNNIARSYRDWLIATMRYPDK